MFGKQITLLTLFGYKIRIDLSWTILAIVQSLFLATALVLPAVAIARDDSPADVAAAAAEPAKGKEAKADKEAAVEPDVVKKRFTSPATRTSRSPCTIRSMSASERPPEAWMVIRCTP